MYLTTYYELAKFLPFTGYDILFNLQLMNIYLGNLNYRVQEEDLQKRLEEYGAVDSVRVIKDRETGRSRGYAFAEMPNDEEANRAIAELNDQTFEGRRLVAKVALPRP